MHRIAHWAPAEVLEEGDVRRLDVGHHADATTLACTSYGETDEELAQAVTTGGT